MAEIHGRESITVLGCGLMGAGVARAFAEAEHTVSIWNRTPEKAQALTTIPGITMGHSPASACGANTIVSVLEGYDAVRTVLQRVPDLRGKTIVNLSTGSRQDAFEMNAWIGSRGAKYLDGTILCYPQNIGTPEGLVVYSGSQSVFKEHAHQLMTLGRESRYVSDEIGGANIAAMSSAFFITALAAFAESVPYILKSGISSVDIQAIAESLISRLPEQIAGLAEAVETQEFDTDEANVNGYSNAVKSFREAMTKAGTNTVLMAATEQLLAKAQQEGFGNLAMASVAHVNSDE
ncbi:NAD(P)-binding domain-containing protein [Paenarthrobacter sp. NEAU-H11]|uniref:NAD(P)-binding domain-containing protein n=1 Tax=Paenarthrobacter sp. NEAU-H11 TaxID=3423924 RepID=UPI003D35960A